MPGSRGRLNGVAAEGIGSWEIHGYPVVATMRKQHRRYVFASDENRSRAHPRIGPIPLACKIAFLAAAGRQQTDDVANPP